MKVNFALIVAVCTLAWGTSQAETLKPLAMAPAASSVFGPAAPSSIRTVQAEDLSEICPGLHFNRLVTPPTVVPFEIPRGKAYLVTGVDWSMNAAPPSQNVTVNVFVADGSTGTVNGPSGQSTALADAAGHAGASITFSTPIVVSSRQALCIATSPFGASPLAFAVAHGFLADDR